MGQWRLRAVLCCLLDATLALVLEACDDRAVLAAGVPCTPRMAVFNSPSSCRSLLAPLATRCLRTRGRRLGECKRGVARNHAGEVQTAYMLAGDVGAAPWLWARPLPLPWPLCMPATDRAGSLACNAANRSINRGRSLKFSIAFSTLATQASRAGEGAAIAVVTLMRACWSVEVSTTALMHTTLPFK